VSKTYEPPKANELKLGVARVKAGTQGLGYDKILADVVLLLGETAKVDRHEDMDFELIDHLRRKYGQVVLK
jgi:hypothetical protein